MCDLINAQCFMSHSCSDEKHVHAHGININTEDYYMATLHSTYEHGAITVDR